MEEYTTDEQSSSQVKRWFQDNLRIIVSIVIVAAIASGIYSYSKRVETPTVSQETISTEATEEGAEEGSAEIANNDETAAKSETEDQAKKEENQVKKEVVIPQGSSQETESAFIETAGQNDSATRLARRALANYLEKNPDSQLTKEHKIYIEDYLRKNAPEKSVRIGSSMEFSKSLIEKSISQSKQLNERQLKNLEKYSARVTSL